MFTIKFIDMYKGVKRFPEPDGKVLYTYYEPFEQIEVVFTSKNIYIYDFRSFLYIAIYNVSYDIDYIHIRKLVSFMVTAVHKNNYNNTGVKFFQYIRDCYNNAYDDIHCFINDSNDDNPFMEQSLIDPDEFYNLYVKPYDSFWYGSKRDK